MSRIAYVVVLAAGFLCSAAVAQSTPPASQPAPVPQSGSRPAPAATPSNSPSEQSAATPCLPSKTLDELTKALDAAISGPADKDRTCMRQLFYLDARFIPVSKTREGAYAPHVLTLDAWIEAMQKRGKVLFYERQVKVKSETYGHVAHLWSTYELRATPEGEATLRGINSIQAVFDGARWRVTQIMWEAETPSERVPEQYLP
jgi:hypothetical protein